MSDSNLGLAMFKFDENGEYITLDAQLYKRMARILSMRKLKVEVNQKEVAKRSGNDAQVPCPQ